jgi:hypothetical protein
LLGKWVSIQLLALRSGIAQHLAHGFLLVVLGLIQLLTLWLLVEAAQESWAEAVALEDI